MNYLISRINDTCPPNGKTFIKEDLLIDIIHMLYEGQSYPDTNGGSRINGCISQILAFTEINRNTQKQYDTDGYKHLYVAKNLEVEKIQSQFESNSFVLKQRQMIGNTDTYSFGHLNLKIAC